MIKYNCIVIEDEPLAIEIMEDYIKQVPFLALRKVCTDAIDAMEILKTEKIDLIFLDIHLPKLKGFDFLKIITNPPKVIVTTAYHQYALTGYEHSVTDYLVKPIEFNRFLSAVNKILLPPVNTNIESAAQPENPFLYFNVSKKRVKLFLADILYIEAQKEYIKIITTSKSILTKFQLSALERILPQQDFIRVHRSFVVAKNKIEAYSLTEIDVGGKSIPIGRNYKELVQSQVFR